MRPKEQLADEYAASYTVHQFDRDLATIRSRIKERIESLNTHCERAVTRDYEALRVLEPGVQHQETAGK